MGVDDVASCVLYISSINIFWHVLYCQLKSWVCWQKLAGFLSIHSGDEQWKVSHRNVASISKTSFPAGI